MNDVKEKLFGKFSGTHVTKESKDKLWQDVASRCVVLGFRRFEGKNTEALRDNLFGRKKKALKDKMDKAGKTGAKAVVYKPVSYDGFILYLCFILALFQWEKVLQSILVVDSPELKGLPVADAGELETMEERAQKTEIKSEQKTADATPSPGFNRKRKHVVQVFYCLF